MKRFVIPVGVVAAAVALIALLTWGVSTHADTGSIDSRVARHDYPLVPGYRQRLPLLGTNRTASLASFGGHWVLLNVYASWCEPCHAEAPLMAREQRVLADHHARLVGLTYQDAVSATQAFNRHYGLHEPVLRDLSGNFVHNLGTYAVPESFVINPQGRIVALIREEISAKWLNQTVLPLISGQA
ncbi:MAG TPA: TlpA disulfide reductase family protein [Solirubrobacteraceae bacterium]|nr:TlpA disulfide reductase family protein [Solirubrobacteraceae bacterium]